MCRPAAPIGRGARPGRTREALSQRGYVGPVAAGEDNAERVEQYQLGVMRHGLGDVVASCLGDKPRQFLDLLSHCRYRLALLLTMCVRRLPTAGDRISTVSPGFR